MVSRLYFSMKNEVSMAQKEERVHVNFIWHFQVSVQKDRSEKEEIVGCSSCLMFRCLVVSCFFLTNFAQKVPESYVPLVLATRVNIGRKKVTIRQGRRSHEVQKEGQASERSV